MENRESLIAASFTVPHIQKVVAFLIRKPLFSSQERDDLQQDILMYVWSKQSQFDESRGCVEAFVTMLVTSCVRMMIRARRREKRNSGRAAQSLDVMLTSCSSRSGGSRSESHVCIAGHEDSRLSRAKIDVPMQVHKFQMAALTKAQVPAEHHRFLIDVTELGVSGAASLHGMTRGQVQKKVLAIGRTLISRAATSAAA